MSEIKHIGAMTLGIIGSNLSDRDEKIKEILESDTSAVSLVSGSLYEDGDHKND